MKSIYYKRLIAERMELSAADRIVYSNLVYNAICGSEEAWEKEFGYFDVINLMECDRLEIGYSITCGSLEKRYPVKRSNASNIIQSLICNNKISKDRKYVYIGDVYIDGYFTLKTESGLKGELLIFYSWLYDMAKESKKIFCTRKRLSELYHSDINTIMFYLKQLKKHGLIERENKCFIIK